MNEIHASRLNPQRRRRGSFLDDKLPIGSLQRRLTFWVGIPFVVLVILYLIGNDIVMPVVTRHGDEFALPDLTDLSLPEAEMKLEQIDLKYEVTSEQYSPGKEKGVVLNQFPIGGTKVKTGRVIKLVTSLGQKLVPIPNLSGESVRQAILDLETAGMHLGEIAWAFSDTMPEKVVVFSYPASGTQIPMGSPVNLMVNRGRASSFTYMPKVIGLSLDEAKRQLEDKSLKVGIITYRTDENYLPETVLEQSESEGTELDVNTEIDLVVSGTG